MRDADRSEFLYSAVQWMRICSQFLAAALVVVVLLLLMGRAHAECAQSSVEAKKNGATWASWSLRVPGHKGQRCWYATGKGERHHFPRRFRREEEEIQIAVPLPLERPAFKHDQPLPQPPVDQADSRRLTDQLLPFMVPDGSPQQRIDDVFAAIGRK